MPLGVVCGPTLLGRCKGRQVDVQAGIDGAGAARANEIGNDNGRQQTRQGKAEDDFQIWLHVYSITTSSSDWVIAQNGPDRPECRNLKALISAFCTLRLILFACKRRMY